MKRIIAFFTGIVHRKRKPFTIEQLDEAVAENGDAARRLEIAANRFRDFVEQFQTTKRPVD